MGCDAGEDARTFCPCWEGGVGLLSFFFGLACGMQAVRKCGKEIPTGEEKITNIPFTASFLCHLLPFLFLSVWLRGAGELHTLPGV